MATSPAFRPVVTAAVEGLTDEAVAERLINHAGGKLGNVHGRRGKGFLRRQIDGYGQAARRSPWLVLVALDMDAECPVGLVRIWLEKPGNTFLCFRVAVREVESWLLADRETLAAYLHVRSGRIPSNPERLEDPKRVVIDVASRSTSRAIREDMGRPCGRRWTRGWLAAKARQSARGRRLPRGQSLRRCGQASDGDARKRIVTSSSPSKRSRPACPPATRRSARSA